MADSIAVFRINGHDYLQYIKAKTGLTISRENTNDKNAGRDSGLTMHPNVTSHQRKLELKMGPMPFSICQQLESDLQGNDDGVTVEYLDLKDGLCKRLFYNTSIKAAIEQFKKDGSVVVDNISFSLTSVKEATV